MNKEEQATFEASDIRVLDEAINTFRQEIADQGGIVIHTQTNVNPDVATMAEWVAEIISGKKLKIPKNYSGLVYTSTVIFRLPGDEEVEQIVKEVKDESPKMDRQKLRIKKENKDNKKWCTCPQCKQRWAFNYFSHCRCGNNLPPADVKKDYEEVWGS